MQVALRPQSNAATNKRTGHSPQVTAPRITIHRAALCSCVLPLVYASRVGAHVNEAQVVICRRHLGHEDDGAHVTALWALCTFALQRWVCDDIVWDLF